MSQFVDDNKMNFMDIYFKVGNFLTKNNYYGLELNDKKHLIDEGLNQYILDKIYDLTGKKIANKNSNLNTTDLFDALSSVIPEEKHFDTIRHFTHFILNIAGDIQGMSITWISDSSIKLDKPVAKFNLNGFWDELNTNVKTDYIESFYFTYDIFKNRFMNKNIKDKTNK